MRKPVTKTDIMRYLRCPYAFWAIDSGLIGPQEHLSAAARRILERGVSFEAAIQADLPIDERPEEEAFADDIRLHQVWLHDTDLGIAGIVDAVDTQSGALVPVEIKAHRRPSAKDRLELAFYWMLLEHARTRPCDPPRGVLVLAGEDREPYEREIALTSRHFARVRELIDAVRAARRDGVAPRGCNCEVCAGPLAEVVADAVRARDDITRVRGIKRVLARRFAICGIHTATDLVGANIPALVDDLALVGPRIGEATIQRYVRSARSQAAGVPVRADDEPPLPNEALYLDLEFDSSTRRVWLAGISDSVAVGRYRHWWAIAADDEPALLDALANAVAEHPLCPVVTWNGASDLAALRHACERWGRMELHADVSARHLCLFQHTHRHIGMPLEQLRLDDIGSFLGRAPSSNVEGGLMLLVAFEQLADMPAGAERTQLMGDLMRYNRDDVLTLAAFHRYLLGDGNTRH